MWRRALVLCLLAAACAAAPAARPRRPRPRIVGGQPVEISQFPWQASVQLRGHHYCGGSVISAAWALSAAHCLFVSDPSDFSLRVGTSTRESGGAVYQAADVRIHPDFSYTNGDCDIAVVSISGSFSFGDNIQAVSLGTAELAAGTPVTITGWGAVDHTQILPTELQAVSTVIVSRSACNAAYSGAITENMVCAGEYGRGACNGDSGGPLVHAATQYGVVSMGYCARGAPEVYSSVAALRAWISTATGV